jgi:hypothetical protein
MTFILNNTEQMRLTSTGLGIGITAPAYKLVVSAAGASGIEFGPAFSGTANLIQSYSRSGGVYVDTVYEAAQHRFNIAGSEKARIDSSGNVGIGVTPSAWGSSYKVLEIGSNSYVNGLYVGLASNAYNNGTNWIYKTTNFASRYESNFNAGGIHAWFTAPSGTAGTTATFTESMRIDSSGRLLVGITTGSFNARITSYNASSYTLESIRTGTGSEGHAVFVNANGAVGSIFTNASLTIYNTTSDYRLKTVVGVINDSGTRIDALHPVEYTWNSNGQRTRGFLAHQFQEVYADSVTGTKDAVDAEGKPVYQQMQASTSEVIADLVAEIQSLRKRLADAGIA